jgi:hypothetical protein
VNVLFFVEPLVMHGRPFHYWAWLGFFADMARAIGAAGGAARVVVNDALAVRAVAPRDCGTHARRGQGLAPADVVALAQEPIRALFDAPNVAIVVGLHRGTHAPAAVDAYGALVRGAVGEFEPDVVLSLTPADQLRAAYPRALHLAAETAAYSRAPFPMCLFFDPAGLWDRSVPAARAAELCAREPAGGERALLDEFRRRFGAYFAATTPFAGLERELRARHRRLAFLPLQFGGEPGFDANAPFRNQGEYLFHVLERLPDDVGVVIVEHPTAHWIGDFLDEETREYLAERHPRATLVDFRAADSAGQYLVHHADFVVSVSSSLAFQALLFERALVAVGHSHLVPFAAHVGLAGLPAELPARDARVDRALAWLLTHYFVPLELCRRPEWLVPYLERGVERARDGRLDLGFFGPIAPADELGAMLFRTLDDMSARQLRGVVPNGDFAAWSRGPGPSWVGQEGPDGWHFLDFSGGVGEVRRVRLDGGAAASVRRRRVGDGPMLFLARVPDAAAAAGRLARLRFRARSPERAAILVYLYLQVDDGQPGMGTQAQLVGLDGDWRDHAHVGLVPALGDRTPGPRSHLEVVFALPPEAGAASFEVADVRLDPVAV